MPGSSVSAVQIAAHKKLVLVNLILTGKVRLLFSLLRHVLIRWW